MSYIRKIQFDAMFEDTELCSYLETNNVCVEGLKKIMEDAMFRVLENTVNRTDAINDAMNTGIKNYTRISKAELIKRLWNKTETIDKVNLKRMKTCNNKSKARREATNNNIETELQS